MIVQLEISKYDSAVTYKIIIVNVLMLSLCLEFHWKILSWLYGNQQDCLLEMLSLQAP